jgi:hypothetical protein
LIVLDNPCFSFLRLSSFFDVKRFFLVFARLFSLLTARPTLELVPCGMVLQFNGYEIAALWDSNPNNEGIYPQGPVPVGFSAMLLERG